MKEVPFGLLCTNIAPWPWLTLSWWVSFSWCRQCLIGPLNPAIAPKSWLTQSICVSFKLVKMVLYMSPLYNHRPLLLTNSVSLCLFMRMQAEPHWSSLPTHRLPALNTPSWCVSIRRHLTDILFPSSTSWPGEGWLSRRDRKQYFRNCDITLCYLQFYWTHDTWGWNEIFYFVWLEQILTALCLYDVFKWFIQAHVTQYVLNFQK